MRRRDIVDEGYIHAVPSITDDFQASRPDAFDDARKEVGVTGTKDEVWPERHDFQVGPV